MLVLKFVLGLVPILWLIVALTVLKMPGFKACPIAVLFAGVTAVLFKGLPLVSAATSVVEGVCTALWPIILVILAALFVYGLSLETGAMDKIKAMLAGVSRDRRVLLLLIGWSFGCFMEGMAGFGTAVAIPGSILVALGFDPLRTLLALLVANSTPTAFGSVGVPLTSLESATGLAAGVLSANTALISVILMFLSPFFMVFIVGGGFKAFKGLLPFTLLSSLAFVIPNFLLATFAGPELPDIIGSICSLVLSVLVALRMKDREIPEEYLVQAQDTPSDTTLTAADAVRAWSPFILIFFLLLFTSKLFPFINGPLSSVSSSIQLYVGEDAAPSNFTWINTPGVWIILAGILGGLIQGASLPRILSVLVRTVRNNLKTILTICSVLVTAKLMVHSGMTTDVADVLVIVAGRFYPLFSPLVGVLGGFVTGSGTNTSVLFGPLQAEAASQLGIAQEWLGAANSLGAGVGKMISPSNVALGCAAVGLSGKESTVIGSVFKYCLLYAIVGGIICFALA